ncbi:MAG: ABC transporter ATP-binding protein [Cytophagales bacterium]|nr:MAG: ABC transporter ATP-binding protein [Cytophagales bacterium]
MNIQNVSFGYKNGFVLQDVSFTLPNPSIFGLIGPNGAGKTTLFSILSGILKPSSGTFVYSEKPGLLLQNNALYKEATGRENLQLFCKINRISPNQVSTALEVVEIDSLTANRKYKEYSQGQKQRLLIARAFLTPSKLILLDEPFNAVDLPTMLILKNSIKSIVATEQKTVVISSHHLREIDDLIDSGIILNKGRVIHQFGLLNNVAQPLAITVYVDGQPDRLCSYLLANKYLFRKQQNQISITCSATSPAWPIIRFCEETGIALKRIEYGESLENMLINRLNADNEHASN